MERFDGVCLGKLAELDRGCNRSVLALLCEVDVGMAAFGAIAGVEGPMDPRSILAAEARVAACALRLALQ